VYLKGISLIFVMALMVIFASGALAEEAEDAIECPVCHADKVQVVHQHPAVLMGCEICHAGVDSSKMPHDFGGTERGLIAEPPDLCFMCHDADKFTGEGIIHPPVIAGMCLTCHDPHGSGEVKLLRAPKPEVCYGCHDKAMFYGPTIHAPVGLGTCEACHEPHKSATSQPKLLKQTDPVICFNCHATDAFTKAFAHPPVAAGLCTACHLPHASQNGFLLKRKGNLLCRECHSSVEKKPHVVVGFSAVGHPLRGRRDPVRSGKVFGCLSCHVPHSSDWVRLFRYRSSTMYDLCQNCHDF